MRYTFLSSVVCGIVLLCGCSSHTKVSISNLSGNPVTVEYTVDVPQEGIFTDPNTSKTVFFYAIEPNKDNYTIKEEVTNATLAIDDSTKRVSFELAPNTEVEIASMRHATNDPSSDKYERFNLKEIKIRPTGSSILYAEGDQARYLFQDIDGLGKAIIIR